MAASSIFCFNCFDIDEKLSDAIPCTQKTSFFLSISLLKSLTGAIYALATLKHWYFKMACLQL